MPWIIQDYACLLNLFIDMFKEMQLFQFSWRENMRKIPLFWQGGEEFFFLRINFATQLSIVIVWGYKSEKYIKHERLQRKLGPIWNNNNQNELGKKKFIYFGI